MFQEYDNNEFMPSIFEWAPDGQACASLAVYLSIALR